jgi:hypothetical protein
MPEALYEEPDYAAAGPEFGPVMASAVWLAAGGCAPEFAVTVGFDVENAELWFRHINPEGVSLYVSVTLGDDTYEYELFTATCVFAGVPVLKTSGPKIAAVQAFYLLIVMVESDPASKPTRYACM